MEKYEEWNEFLNNLHSKASKTYKETTEYEYVKKRQDEMERAIRDNLMTDQKELVEECVFEIGIMNDRESEILYRQGMEDCVWILKKLGVLA
jgi:hypothetical protein